MSGINAIAHQVNTISKFEADFHNLLEVIGKADVNVLPNGSAVNVYKEAVLATVEYAEGALIPDSKATPVLDHTVVLEWTPLRSIAPYQKIQVQGFDVAVGGTADKLMKQIAASVRASLCAAIATGTAVATAGATVQAAAANAAAKMMEKCADESGTPVFFMSPSTFAAYAGVANITTQSAYGTFSLFAHSATTDNPCRNSKQSAFIL